METLRGVAQSDLSLDHLYVVHPGEHDYPLDDAITAITLPHLLDVRRKRPRPRRDGLR